MSLPLVTRFGADPLLDLEVANKRYVDNNIAGGKFFFSCDFGGTATNGRFFGAPVSETTYDLTFTNRSVEVFIDFEVTRVTVRVLSNTKDDVSRFGLVDDTVDSGFVAVPDNSSGLFDSGALSVAVASGSAITSLFDMSRSTAGSINQPSSLVECTPT